MAKDERVMRAAAIVVYRWYLSMEDKKRETDNPATVGVLSKAYIYTSTGA
jgi:hypothetical protein